MRCNQLFHNRTCFFRTLLIEGKIILFRKAGSMQISQKLRIAAKLSEKRHYEIAHEAGLHPSTLSRILCGIEQIRRDDFRVIAIGKVLGIPREECFQEYN
jgi:hypothetical protein